MSRPPKLCVYCGKEGVSKEHVRGHWSIPHGRMHSRNAHMVARPDPLAPGVLTDPVKGAANRPGTPRALTLKIACERCNNGWMSAIQRDAIPTLTNLNYGIWGQISNEEMSQLARWITLFTMSYEQADRASASVDFEERNRFSMTSDPGQQWQIAVGYVDTKLWSDATFHRCFGLPSDIVFCGNRKFQFTASMFGRFLFVSHYSAYPISFDFKWHAKNMGLTPLWPDLPRRMTRPHRVHQDGIVRSLISYFSDVFQTAFLID